MSGMSRQDWWDGGDSESSSETRAEVERQGSKKSWFLGFLSAFFIAILFSVGADLVLRLVEEGRLRVPASWLGRVDLALGLAHFFLGAGVGLAIGRLGGLSGRKAALASFLLALCGMTALLLLQSGLMQPRVYDIPATDLWAWLQARSLAVYGLALLGLLVAWFLPFRTGTR
jgi:hypothetical protein